MEQEEAYQSLIRDLSSKLTTACAQLKTTRYELNEANAELIRHHRDFQEISIILDTREATHSSLEDDNYYLAKIRNIVG